VPIKSIVWGFIGIVGCFSTFVVANWISPIASALSSSLLEILFLALAAGVWLAKFKIKIFYAMWELQVGLFALIIAAKQALLANSYEPDQRNSFFCSLMGGIFLVVRGIDDLIETFPKVELQLKKWGFL